MHPESAQIGGAATHASYARAIAPLLPPAAFRQNPRRLAYAAVQLALYLAVVFGMRFLDAIVWRVAASVVAGHALLGLALFAHELSHGAVVRRGPFQRLMELVSWGPNLVSPMVWRKIHNEAHHRHANTPSDPDRRFSREEAGITTRAYTRLFYPARGGLLYNPLILLHFVPYVVKQTLGALLPPGKLALLPSRVPFSLRERVQVLFDLGVIAALQWGVFHLSGAEADRYLFAGPIAVAWTSAFVMLYVFTNHFASPLGTRADPLTTTTSVVVPPLVDKLHLHFSFHTEHHLFPALDSSYFPLVSRLLSERYPALYVRVPLREAWRRAFEQPVFVQIGAAGAQPSPPSMSVEPVAAVER